MADPAVFNPARASPRAALTTRPPLPDSRDSSEAIGDFSSPPPPGSLPAPSLPEPAVNRPGAEKYPDEEPLDPRTMTTADWRRIGFGPDQPPVLKSIREKCLDCCCGQPLEVRLCPSAGCALWPYRMATNPFRAPRSEESRVAFRDRMAAARGHPGTASPAVG